MTLIDDLASEALVADSYERVKADLAAVPVEQLLQLNVDVQSAARIILGSLPEIKKLRDRIVKELPSVDIQTFDKLEDYAQALKYAQANQQLASEPQDDGPELETMGKELRDRMIADAQALALYKLFDGQLLDRLKGGNGINNLAEDLELLSQAMLNSWSKIQGKALTPLEDVHTASRIGLRLTHHWPARARPGALG